jgi:acetyl esterase
VRYAKATPMHDPRPRASAIVLAAGLLVAAYSGAGATDPCSPLAPAGTQGGALLPGGLMNVRYADVASGPLAMDVYPHADGAERPLAVVLRGGRGTVGQRSSYVGQLIELFAEAGYIVAAPDYRSGSARDGASDLLEALRVLTNCHASELHIDPSRVVLVGEDTAAIVVLQAAARLEMSGRAGALVPPAAIVIAGGRFDRESPAPVRPTWVVHGENDSEVPLAEAQAVCALAPRACTVLPVEGASHRVENWWPSQWGYKADVLQALAALVGPVPRAAWPARASLHKDVVYDPRLGLALDAYVPPEAGPHPAVVLVHGGGWEAGDRVTYIAPMFALAASRGLAWISVGYRLTPAVGNREQVDDVHRALAWIRLHARELRVDPARLALVGESASGQLVSLVAATDPDLAGVVSFYGVYDLAPLAGDPVSPRSRARRLFGLTTLDEKGLALLRDFSPLHRVSKRMPPLLLVAGTADRLVEQQRAYAAALRAAGVPHDTFEVDGAPHGMEAWHDEPRWRVWGDAVGGWIAARLRT